MDQKAVESALHAGFKAGWIAACITLAVELDKVGFGTSAAVVRARARAGETPGAFMRKDQGRDRRGLSALAIEDELVTGDAQVRIKGDTVEASALEIEEELVNAEARIRGLEAELALTAAAHARFVALARGLMADPSGATARALVDAVRAYDLTHPGARG